MLFFFNIYFVSTLRRALECSKPIVSGTVAIYGGNCEITNEYIKTGGLISSFTEMIIDTGPTIIKTNAFKGCSSLQKVKLSDTIQQIQANAFIGCPKLASFAVNKTNKYIFTDSIGLFNFQKTKLLRVASAITSYSIPDSVEYIESGCFLDSKQKCVIIPPKVTSLGFQCFPGGGVSEVKFASGSMIKTISYGAFCWWSPSLIHIPPSVTKLEESSFYNGYGTVVFDDVENSNLTTIGKYSLGGLGMSSLKLPEGLTSLPQYSFIGCGSLTEINIPSKCTFIDPTAFSGCFSLKKITIGTGNSHFRYNEDGALVDRTETTIYMIKEDSDQIKISATIKTVASGALQARKLLTKLEVDVGNEAYSSYENVLYDKNNTTVLAIPGGVKRSVIHPNATTIGEAAGYGTSIKVFDCKDSKKLKYIGGEAFRASAITCFVFPSSLTEIQARIFYSCGSLINVTFAPGCNIKTFGDEVFRYSGLRRAEIADSMETINCFPDCAQLEVIVISENSQLSSVSSIGKCPLLKNFTIYPTLKTISSRAFEGDVRLVVDFSRSQLVSIGDAAFDGCQSIEEIFLPGTLTSLGSTAFRGCSGATKLTFDENIQIKELRSSCFDGCAGLVEVELPKLLSKIDYSVFHGCGSLKMVTVREGNQNLKSVEGIVYDAAGKNLIFCSSGRETADIIDGIEGIEGNAFYECKALGSVNFPSECFIERIKSNTFMGCVRLGSIEIPPSVGVLESGSFSGCESLGRVYFKGESSLTEIGEETFSSCKALTEVIFEDISLSSLNKISPRAFSGCSLLYTFTFPDSLKTVGDSAFSGTSIKEIDLEHKPGIQYLEHSFDGMESLETFTFSSKSNAIPPKMFKGCNSLHTVIFPTKCSIKEIPSEGFINAINLGTIKFSENIKFVRNSAFKGLQNLSTVTGIDRVSEIGSEGFYGTKLKKINLLSIKALGESAFERCSELKEVNFNDPLSKKATAVEVIPKRCFAECSSLSAIDITKVKVIEEESFLGTGFEAIEVGAGFNVIGNKSFKGCRNLNRVIVKSKNITVKSEVFANCESLTAIQFCGTVIQTASDSFDCINPISKKFRIYVPVTFDGATLGGVAVVRRIGDDCAILPSVIDEQHYSRVNCFMIAATLSDDCGTE